MQRTRAMKKPYLSKDWDEGEDIEIEGIDRKLKMKLDNYSKRWHPYKNNYIKMKKRI